MQQIPWDCKSSTSPREGYFIVGDIKHVHKELYTSYQDVMVQTTDRFRYWNVEVMYKQFLQKWKQIY